MNRYGYEKPVKETKGNPFTVRFVDTQHERLIFKAISDGVTRAETAEALIIWALDQMDVPSNAKEVRRRLDELRHNNKQAAV